MKLVQYNQYLFSTVDTDGPLPVYLWQGQQQNETATEIDIWKKILCLETVLQHELILA